jgi:lactate dehydrogenase-like 2-hydroxyacid dehydrogenase
MTKPEILLTLPIYPPVVAELEREFTVHRLWTADDAQKFVKDAGAGVRAVVTSGIRGCSRELIEALPALELIACFGTPHGTIDYESAVKRGVLVTNTPDSITDTVAELAAGMTVSLMRRICENDRFVRAGRWPQGAPSAGNTLMGKRCGVVGLGRIGLATATRLEAFGMSIAWQGPRRKADVRYTYHAEVESLARESDCLVVTCPLTPETRNLIDAKVLDALGPEGFLVNVARGPIVEETALIAALTQKKIAGAALDVFWDEPRVPAALIKMENVVLLPHVGSTTREVREERGRKLMANLHAHFSGKPVPNPVAS